VSNSNTPTILITGATGNVGRELTKKLSASAIPFCAMVRSTKGAEEVAALESAEVILGDFNDMSSIAAELDDFARDYAYAFR